MQKTPPINRAMPASALSVGPRDAAVRGSAPDSALTAFRSHGGVAHAEEVIDRLQGNGNQPMSRLGRWIAGREVLNLNCHGVVWLPRFQFDFDVGDIRPEAARVIDTLAPAYDGLEMIMWFVEANTWLDGEVPLSRLACDAASVLQAARADRFVVLG